MQPKGNRYGIHRVIEPEGILTQAANKVSNDMTTLYSNEILCDVHSLNIDSASFTQIEEACENDEGRIARMILDIVAQRGKMQNPVTGSGGMFIGAVEALGEGLADIDLRVGDRIVSLVSLSMTPLRIDRIKAIHRDIDRVDIQGKAILFESALYAKLPDDMPDALALAALDVAGAPAQTAKLVRPGDRVLVLGAAGKSGILCSYEARKRVGPTGLVVGLVPNQEQADLLESLAICHEIVIADATRPVDVMEAALRASGGVEYDVSISCVNVENTEMGCILPVRDGGVVYFFSMATSFTKAALGAEGIGKDVTMIIGNGYTTGHAEITLAELRESPKIRALFERIYC